MFRNTGPSPIKRTLETGLGDILDISASVTSIVCEWVKEQHLHGSTPTCRLVYKLIGNWSYLLSKAGKVKERQLQRRYSLELEFGIL